MLGPQDVGYRVVVRRIIGIRNNRPLYSDALGELLDLDSTGLTVATREGPIRIEHHAIQAAKRVPARAADVVTIERLANAAWPAAEVEMLGSWLLRATDGWTGRANSALPIGRPGMARDAAIEAVTSWYTARGLRPGSTYRCP